MKNLQALGEWVIIKPIEEKKETKTGIVTPDVKNTLIGEGEVLFADTDKIVGSKVLFNRPASDEVEIDSEKLILIKKENVIAIISE